MGSESFKLGPLVVPVITVGLQSVITWIRDNTK